MAQSFDPLRSKFTATALADFCATYYAVIRSFGNHWDEIRADCYSKLKDLPPAKYGKPSSFRLFYLRRFIEKALELAGMSELLRFQMFRMEHWRLQTFVSQKLTGIVVDSWVRAPDHLEMVVYVPQFPPIRYISVRKDVVDQIGLNDAAEVERCRIQLEVPDHVKIKYIARVSVKAENVRLFRIERVLPHQMHGLVLLTDDVEQLNKGLTCHSNGEMTFELFGFHESTEVNRLSELTLYAVEPLRFASFRMAPDNYKQALVGCTSTSGQEIVYRADLARVRTFSKGQPFAALTKRVWNSDQRFILVVEVLSEISFQEVIETANRNMANVKQQLSFIPVKDILDNLPLQGDLREVGDLEPGHFVVHPDYGPGTVKGKAEWLGQTVVEFQFMKQHYKAGRIFIPATKKLPAYWRDLALLDN